LEDSRSANPPIRGVRPSAYRPEWNDCRHKTDLLRRMRR